MITVYSDDHRRHHATAELNDGKLMPPFEMPRRAEMVLAAVKNAQMGEVIAPDTFGVEPIVRVHDAGYVAFLQTAWEHWRIEHGDYDALPLNWAIRTMRSDRIPEVIDGKLSYYSFDAGTPITSGTWVAASSSANVALTGQARITQGQPAAFALCRPPGHHAGKDFLGGYCFLNNVAIAAQAFRDAGADRVAILDIDYHHGNGTQAIFYDRADVMFVSIHAHPLQDYPYFLGYDDEIGIAAGTGFNRNYPLRWGTDWAVYSQALTDAIATLQTYRPNALLISLGVDTFEGDPISKFRLQEDDYARMGQAIAQVGVPTLFVMEGGYAVDAIGTNAVNILLGFESP